MKKIWISMGLGMLFALADVISQVVTNSLHFSLYFLSSAFIWYGLIGLGIGIFAIFIPGPLLALMSQDTKNTTPLKDIVITIIFIFSFIYLFFLWNQKILGPWIPLDNLYALLGDLGIVVVLGFAFWLLGKLIKIISISWIIKSLSTENSMVRKIGKGVVIPLTLALFVSFLWPPPGKVFQKDLSGNLLKRTHEEQVDFQQANTSRTQFPNMVLITIETWRADHFDFLGNNHRLITPNIDSFARKGVVFRNYYVEAPWTRPSITSLFTSLYPQQHGCNSYRARLAANAATLPRALNRLGYTTYSFVSNNLASDPNFGFHYVQKRFPPSNPEYLSPFSYEHLLIAPILVKLQLYKVIQFPPYNSITYFDAKRLNTSIEKIVNDGLPHPFFLHIHYIDPHKPYYYHPYKEMQLNLFFPSNKETLISQYNEEIRFVDAAIGDLWTMLIKKGKNKNTILIITSDHGEEFYDHGSWGHGETLFDELLHVPLIIYSPLFFPEAKQIDRAVGSVDIAPTILDLIKVPIPKQFRGASLLPLIAHEDTLEKPILSFVSNPLKTLTSIRKGRYKLIRDNKDKRSEMLFDIKNDPGEKININDKEDVWKNLSAELDMMEDFFLKNNFSPQNRKPLTLEEREQLRSLGYIN